MCGFSLTKNFPLLIHCDVASVLLCWDQRLNSFNQIFHSTAIRDLDSNLRTKNSPLSRSSTDDKKMFEGIQTSKENEKWNVTLYLEFRSSTHSTHLSLQLSLCCWTNATSSFIIFSYHRSLLCVKHYFPTRELDEVQTARENDILFLLTTPQLTTQRREWSFGSLMKNRIGNTPVA